MVLQHPSVPGARLRGLLVIGIMLALGFAVGLSPDRAQAAVVHEDSYDYAGLGEYTRIFFDRSFTANLPEWLPDRADGKLRARIVFESTTRATIHAPSTLTASASAAPRQGESLTVSTSQQPFDGAEAEELLITTRPAVHILWDYQPDDLRAFGCSPFDTAPAQFNRNSSGVNPFVVPVALSSGDQNERCGSITVTANMLLGLGLPEYFQLIKESFVPPMSGEKHFQRNQKLFDIRVCKMLSHYFPAVAFLGDSCWVDIVGIAEADLLVGNAATDGYRATVDYLVDVTMPMSGVTIPTRIQSASRELSWPSTSAVAHAFNVPCSQQAGKAMYYRLRNNRYAARVKSVELGIAAEFWVDPPALQPRKLFTIFTLDGLLDLLDGNEIAVSATATNPTIPLGNVLAESEDPTAAPGGPYTGVEGSPITLTAQGTGPRGSFDNCDADGNELTYEWAFIDGTSATGKSVNKTFADNGGANGGRGATLTVRDAAGNQTGIPFVITVNNVAPSATFSAPATLAEGGALTIALTNPSDPSATDMTAGFSYAFDCGDGSGYGAYGNAASRACGAAKDNGTRTVKGKIRDKDGGEREYTQPVSITNVAPTAQLTPSARQIVPLGTTVSFSAAATDPGAGDTLTYSWGFGDGSTATGGPTLTRTDGKRHAFTRPCICTVTLNVKDKDLGAAPTQTVQVIVYDTASKVTGDAKFLSDANSIGVTPGALYSVATSVQYDKGVTAPKGSLTAEAPDARLTVRMSSFDFLVVTEREAVFEGPAAVNGASGWKFRITMPLDGSNVTLVGWRPGQSTLDRPEYRIGGPRKEGSLKAHMQD